jgi:hypothetical protein
VRRRVSGSSHGLRLQGTIWRNCFTS